MSNGRRIEWWQWPIPGLLTVIAKITLFQEWPQLGELINQLYQWFAEPGDKHMYLLSATAQTLGAVFAIVFAITPLVVQQLSRYISKPLRYVFKPRMLAYIAGFALSITIPLWCLIKPSGLGSFISLVIGSSFIISLIWYFRYILKKSDIDNLASSLRDEGLKSVTEGKYKEAEDRINSLDGIILRSISFGEYTVLNRAANELVRFALGIEEKVENLEEGTESRRLHFLIFETVHATAKEMLGKPRALEEFIKNIGIVGADAILKGKISTEFSAAHNIWLIGTMCDDETQIQLSIQCFYSLFWMMTKHLSKAPLVDMVGRAQTMQDFYIDRMLQIYDIHLKKGWQNRLEWLLRSIVEFILRYEPSKHVATDILVTIWLTDARFEKPDTRRLYHSLEENGILEDFLKEELFNSAVEKGKKLGIPEERLKARWDAFQKFNDWRKGKLGNVGPPED